jgi:hypothetical protein
MLPERVETESEKLTTYLTVKMELHGSPWIAVMPIMPLTATCPSVLLLTTVLPQ